MFKCCFRNYKMVLKYTLDSCVSFRFGNHRTIWFSGSDLWFCGSRCWFSGSGCWLGDGGCRFSGSGCWSCRYCRWRCNFFSYDGRDFWSLRSYGTFSTIGPVANTKSSVPVESLWAKLLSPNTIQTDFVTVAISRIGSDVNSVETALTSTSDYPVACNDLTMTSK